jgi:hypothetical protein
MVIHRQPRNNSMKSPSAFCSVGVFAKRTQYVPCLHGLTKIEYTNSWAFTTLNCRATFGQLGSKKGGAVLVYRRYRRRVAAEQRYSRQRQGAAKINQLMHTTAD